jgi:hypothetical protein
MNRGGKFRTTSANAGQFAALGSPSKLELLKSPLAALLTINWALATEGAEGSGHGVLAVGSEVEVDAALARARALPLGGPYAVEFSPAQGSVRVSHLSEVHSRAREFFASGHADPEGWYVVAVGDEKEAQRRATQLRRVRAGRRVWEGVAR